MATVSSSGIVTGVAAGTATISYTTTNSCGSNFATIIITVSPLANAGTITGATTVCAGAAIVLGDSTASTSGTWSSSASSVATVSASGVVTGVSAGTANITYTVTTACGTANTSIIITVNPLPNAGIIIGASSLCTGGVSTTLTDSVAGGIWSSSNTAVATISSTGVVRSVSTGTAVISYTVTRGGCSATATAGILVNPYAGVISGAASICRGSTTTLAATGATGGVWTSTATSVATISSAGVVTGVNNGTTTIKYTVTNSCGTSVATFALTVVLPGAIAPITGTTTVCPGATITLADTTLGGTWSSRNTSRATVNAATGVVTGVSSGTDTIAYTASNACGAATVIKVITITAPPAPGAITGPGGSVCPGATVSLADGTTGGVWSSTNTAVATVSAAGIVTGVSGGTDSIVYTVTNSCGLSGSATRVVVVSTSTSGTISGPTSLCAGSSITLTDGVSGGTWSSSNLSIATISSAGVVRAIAAGTTTITYAITNSCGTLRSMYTVTVNPLPNAGTISGAASICASGATTTYTDASAGGTWSSTNPSVATITSAGLITGLVAGTTTISYVVTNGCGTAATATALTVMPLPVSGTISGPSIVCISGSITLTDSVAGGVWSSLSSGFATVSPSTGIVTGLAAGTSTIRYTVTTACGTSVASYGITIIAPGTLPAITGTATVCPGATTTLADATTGGTWSSMATVIATVSSATGVVTGVNPGIDTIIYTATNACGTFTTSKAITVTSPPVPSGITGTGGAICPGASITLSDGTTGGVWTTSTPSIATVSATGVVTGVAGGIDTIIYTITNSCGQTGSARRVVPVTTTPYVDVITGSATVAVGSFDTLSVGEAGGTWSSTNTHLATIGSAGIVTANYTGIDTIKYTVTNGCGSAVTRKVITIVPSGGRAVYNGGSTPELDGAITLFPNPATSNINIEWTGAQKGTAIILITDMLGKEVYRGNWDLQATAGKATTDVSTLKSGIYIINIKSETITYSSRIVVEQ